ncbi:MerR family transcriptional regulator [Levilactobacillus tongjiangensis]|uniref:MerR family transcriptional regulator n=1 Tax=Levilactobacillus tongjiangensis TaxID=2486023 RepID=A0ABW1STG3_9LACO|nr:MerR family transcriptional regulator [Levilactobacillus tongjiangensis]
MNTKQYRIGEFARLTGVKKQTLLWYDKIGLFNPAEIGPNGYRYYTLNQFDLFSVIRSFQSIGMSLEEIKNILQNRNPQSSQKIFSQQLKKVQKEITLGENLASSLQQRIQIIQSAKTVDTQTIHIESQPAQFLFRSKSFQDISPEEQAVEISKITNFRYQTNQFGSALGAMVGKDNFLSGKTVYNYYYCEVRAEDSNYIKPQGTYLTGFYHGDYRDTYKIYMEIRRYAHQHHFELGPYSYEQSFIDETLSATPQEYLTRVSIPLQED